MNSGSNFCKVGSRMIMCLGGYVVEYFSAWYVEPSDCCRWGLCTSQRLSSIGFRCRGILLARLGYALTRNRIIPSACGREGWWCYSGSSSGQLLCFSTVHEMSVRNSTSRTGGQIKSAPASNRRKKTVKTSFWGTRTRAMCVLSPSMQGDVTP